MWEAVTEVLVLSSAAFHDNRRERWLVGEEMALHLLLIPAVHGQIKRIDLRFVVSSTQTLLATVPFCDSLFFFVVLLALLIHDNG